MAEAVKGQAPLASGRGAFLSYLARLPLPEETPDVPVTFDFSYTLQLPKAKVCVVWRQTWSWLVNSHACQLWQHHIDTVPAAIARWFSLPLVIARKLQALRSGEVAAEQTTPLLVLKCNGDLQPGTLTLLITPPGHGKTSLMRALSGRIAPELLEGRIEWGGRDAGELHAAGISLARLACFVDQLDTHLPLLTVRETVAFAWQNLTVPPALHGDAEAAAKERVERALAALSLQGCADTVVGDALTRGVSGGERKRVTIAEALVSNARVLCLDEISTGLDASVTYDIVAALKGQITALRQTGIISLLQATPEVVSLFDAVLLLREGCTVYHGPTGGLDPYLRSLGFSPPVAGAATGGKGDLADWLVDWLTDPRSMLPKRGAHAKGVPVTTPALVAAWAAASANTAVAPAKAAPITLPASGFAAQQFGLASPRPVREHVWSLIRRQAIITARNRLFVITRLASACVISVVIGSLWLHISQAHASQRWGLLLFALLSIAFGNQGELPFAVANKWVAYKHISAGMFPPMGYALAHTMLHIPIAIAEVSIYAVVVYWMTGFSAAASRFFYYAFILFLTDIAMGSLFRVFAFGAKSLEEAQTKPAGFIAIQVLFSGFMIRYTLMGWMQFLYYVSIFGYALHSLAINEFGSSHYTSYHPGVDAYFAAHPGSQLTTAQVCAGGLADCSTQSQLILHDLSLLQNPAWRWAPIGFITGVAVLFNLAAGKAISNPIASNIGTGRDLVAEAEGNAETPPEAAAFTAVALPPTQTATSALPFSPMTVVWRRLGYSVTLPDTKEQKTLLHSVTGIAQPGRMVALMGASGAGKTTLLDVLAGRKNSGTMTGDILLNGFPKEPKSFARLTGYVEQQDIHGAFSTVGEALRFAAVLRLPADVPAETRESFVVEVEALLGMAPLRGRLVGDVGSLEGLSPGERKVLTIAVELVSNAPILFLDEPTSGLDSRAAALVIRAVSAVAATQRSVICTIHQPNATLYSAFHDLLLLQRGGWMAYCGPLEQLEAHLMTMQGVRSRPAGMNIASWMLDVLSGSDSSALVDVRAGGASALPGPMLQETLFSSPGWEAMSKLVEAHAAPAPGAAAVRFDSVFATSTLTQLRVVLARRFTSYLRNIGYNETRIKRLLMLQVLFGTVYYKVKVQDAGGVASLVAVMYMSTMFVGVLNISTSMPVLLRERAVSYRERASFMYPPEVHAASFALVELPWMALLVLIVIPPVYFMVGLRAGPQYFFFYALVVLTFAYTLVSFGQMVTALVPAADTASALVSAVIPILFLFGGLFIQYPNIPVWWRWLYRLDPLSYAITCIASPQFVRAGCSGPAPQGNCPTVIALGPAGYQAIDKQAYAESAFGFSYDNRWSYLGFIACFAGGFQIVHFIATRRLIHMTR